MDRTNELQELYHALEERKARAKEEQLRSKEVKEEIIEIMQEAGLDEYIVNGLDEGTVLLEITYPEREKLNKKGLAESIKMTQKELSNPFLMIKLTEEGVLTSELIEKFTEIEERMQFSAREVREEEQTEEK